MCIFRALFDHDAIRDDDCPSYGLSFKHGDVLHILNGSDEEWWQAALVGSYADDGPQGLIPSKKRYTIIYINHVLCIYVCHHSPGKWLWTINIKLYFSLP